jgi:glutathione peroxidase
MNKVEVNGPDQDLLFRFLKRAGSAGSAGSGGVEREIEGDFEKFLVDRHGDVVKRYAPSVGALSFDADVRALVQDLPLP